MSSVLPAPLRGSPRRRGMTTAWLVALAGFAAMYLPVYWWAANGIWQTDEQAHGALILAGDAVAVLGPARPDRARSGANRRRAGAGRCSSFGLVVYFVGRVFDISILEFGSQPFVVAGILLLLKGRRRSASPGSRCSISSS